MNVLILALLFRWPATQEKQPQAAELQAVVNKVLNAHSLRSFLTHYSRDTLYFRFSANSLFASCSMPCRRNLVLKTGQGIPLVYNETKNERYNPVIILSVKKLDKHGASLSIGIPVEGAVGHFTLVKERNWNIATQEVYEI